MSNVKFGERLTTLMKEREVSQTDLADAVGIDRSVLSRIMNDRRPPQSHEIGWIAQALEVPVEVLLDGVDLPEPARREVERAQELARRVLEAEQARDAALAELEALQNAHAAELAAQERILETVREENRRALDAANARILETDRGWRTQFDQVAAQRDALAQQVAVLNSRLTSNQALMKQKDAKITNLQTTITQIKSGAGEAAVLVGLLGLAGGAMLGSSQR
ncbi:MAG: helix-turn-helix domain-containing protein [Myxococcota bacterium]